MLRKIVCIVLALMIILAFAGCKGDTTKKPMATTAPQPTEDNSIKKTTLYYPTQSGYIVPVMREVPWEENYGKMVLNSLTASDENTAQLSAMGLVPVIPKDARVSLKIQDGLATVSIGEMKFVNAQQEQTAVNCIVNSLLEFPSVEKVAVFANEKKADTLLYGTKVADPFDKIILNSEPQPVSGMKSAVAMTMYFIDPDGSCIVPVVRYMLQKPDITVAMDEFVKGPKDGWSLKSGLPQGTKLLGISVKNGVAEVNMSKEFSNIAETPELEKKVCKAILFTCKQFGGVESIKIMVEGKEYKLSSAMDAPTFANQIVKSQIKK